MRGISGHRDQGDCFGGKAQAGNAVRLLVSFVKVTV